MTGKYKQKVYHYKKGRKANYWKKEANNLAVNTRKKTRR